MQRKVWDRNRRAGGTDDPESNASADVRESGAGPIAAVTKRKRGRERRRDGERERVRKVRSTGWI